MTKLAIIGVLVLSACSTESVPPVIRTSDQVGVTCGSWSVVTADGGRQFVSVSCSCPLTCEVLAVVERGAGENPAELGVCLPSTQLTCSTTDATTCPTGYECRSTSSSPLCSLPCAATSDCPAPYQVCFEGYCVIRHCNQDPAAGPVQSCPADATCDRVVCDHA